MESGESRPHPRPPPPGPGAPCPAHPGCSRGPRPRSGPRSRTPSGRTGRATAGSSPPGSAALRRCPRSSPALLRSRYWARSSGLCPRGRRGGTAGTGGVSGSRGGAGDSLGGPCEAGRGAPGKDAGVRGPGSGVRAGPRGCRRAGAPSGPRPRSRAGRQNPLSSWSSQARPERGAPLWLRVPPSPERRGTRAGDSPCARRGPARPSCLPGGSSGCSRRRSAPGGRADSKRGWGRPWCGCAGSRVRDWWRSLRPGLFMPGHCVGGALFKRLVV